MIDLIHIIILSIIHSFALKLIIIQLNEDLKLSFCLDFSLFDYRLTDQLTVTTKVHIM